MNEYVFVVRLAVKYLIRCGTDRRRSTAAGSVFLGNGAMMAPEMMRFFPGSTESCKEGAMATERACVSVHTTVKYALK